MSAADEIRQLLASLLIGCGFIIALLCGTCSGAFGILSLISAATNRGVDPFAVTGPFLIAGAGAVSVGIGVMVVGFHMAGSTSGSRRQGEGDDGQGGELH